MSHDTKQTLKQSLMWIQTYTHQSPYLICTNLFFNTIHLLSVLLSPLIYFEPLSPWVCCDKTKPAAGEPLLCRDNVIAIGRRVFDYPSPLPWIPRTLNSAPFISFFRALLLKIASCLASTPRVLLTSGTCLGYRQPAGPAECYLLTWVLTSVTHPRTHFVNTSKHAKHFQPLISVWLSVYIQDCMSSVIFYDKLGFSKIPSYVSDTLCVPGF